MLRRPTPCTPDWPAGWASGLVCDRPARWGQPDRRPANPTPAYETFLDTAQEHLELDDPDEASTLMTVVLGTFSEILYRTERDTLSAPLPKELAHHLHAVKPEHTREQVERLNAGAFLDWVQARADLSRKDAKTATAAVLTVLQEAVGEPMLSDLGDGLPPSYAEVFPFMDRPDSAATG